MWQLLSKVFFLFFSCNSGSCLSGDESYSHEKRLDLDTVYYPSKPNLQIQSVPSRDTTNTRSVATHENIYQQNVSIETIHEQSASKYQIEEIQDEDDISSKHLSKHLVDALNVENDKLSLLNRNLNDQLSNVRSQLGENLNRLRDFEERVKLIPRLQLELSVEKAENRDLHLKLKALENILEQKEKNAIKTKELVKSTVDSSTTTEGFVISKPFSAQRVCAMSLESLNIRFPANNSSSIDAQQQPQNPVKIPPSTNDASSMTNKTISRDVGIVTIPIQISTRNIAINTDISERNPFEKLIKEPILISVGVQSDTEHKIQTRNVSTITDKKQSSSPILNSIGIMAIPNTRSTSCAAKPDSKSIGIDNIYQKVRLRSFGTDPIKHLSETNQSKLINDSINVSLALLDKPSKPKELKSIGIQYSPSVTSRYSQCKEQQTIVTLPKIQTHTESTDTSDLMLYIHRGVNTDAIPRKIDRLTNTNPINTIDKSTNTISPVKHSNDNGTNTDQIVDSTTTNVTNEKSIDTTTNTSKTKSEHKCYNCLAKIEIKQRTIIKNPNKVNLNTNSQTSSSNTTTATTNLVEKHADEMLNVLQQSDSQSRIPRPTALISPRPDRKFARQNTYTIPSTSSSPITPTASETVASLISQCPAEAYLS